MRRTRSPSLCRNHTLADMVHDGLRSDVYAALMAGETGVKKEQILADVAEKAKVFDTAITENKALALPPEAIAVIGGVEQPLESYVTNANPSLHWPLRIGPAALTKLTEFNTAFDTLETAMEDAGAKIEAIGLGIEEGARDFSRMATIATWAGVSHHSRGLYCLVHLQLLRPDASIGRIESTMRALAADSRDVVVPYTDKRNEIGRMAQSIEVFRKIAQDCITLQGEQQTAREKADADRRVALLGFADQFERDVSSVVTAFPPRPIR